MFVFTLWLSVNVQHEDYPTVMIGLFLEQPTPFIREFFQHIATLNYPKSRIDLYIHNKVSVAVNDGKITSIHYA